MTKQITLEQALELVSFKYDDTRGCWQIGDVNGHIHGNIYGAILGSVKGWLSGDVGGDIAGNIYGAVFGNVYGSVSGGVGGRINGREWTFVETPKEKLQRLIDGSSEEELLKLINQLKNN